MSKSNPNREEANQKLNSYGGERGPVSGKTFHPGPAGRPRGKKPSPRGGWGSVGSGGKLEWCPPQGAGAIAGIGGGIEWIGGASPGNP